LLSVHFILVARSCLAQLPNLRNLDLGQNFLYGPVPPELADLTNLDMLGLSSNSLTVLIQTASEVCVHVVLSVPLIAQGGIPPEWQAMKRLRVIDLSK
jgi:hypothetical protein